MSKTKHWSYRKILSIDHLKITIDDMSVKTRFILWCVPESTTHRSIKTRHIAISVYVGGLHQGIRACHSRSLISINLKNPKNSKVFRTWNLKAYMKEALGDGVRTFLLATPSLSQNVSGLVTYWSGTEGIIKNNLGTFTVYACNIKGAKTWYSETACMFLKEGETVEFDLVDMGDFLTPNKVRSNVYFDAKKWASLDQGKLTFKLDESGEPISGLFASEGTK